ncbi:MAG: quinone-dependent dihydroorotate dehydrogenase, partial [Pseudomonadota bacterium]
AGFDKNAEALSPLMRAGFGFLEVGAATPLPQPGNPKPRLFRLFEDRAAINRFGFNNDGVDLIADRLAKRPGGIPVGLNLGANKTSEDRLADFASVFETVGTSVDFVTVNVSSPNTESLRDLQGPAALRDLLSGVVAVRARQSRHVPVFVKIAPDLTLDEIEAATMATIEAGADGMIATNTTLARDGLISAQRSQTGGLSGVPLFASSTAVLARVSALSEGRLALIGVGGIASAEDAYTKIRAGAHAVQLYTAMVYQGLSLAADIANGIDALLKRDGFASVAEAVGTDRDRWC